jgi:hypothetical protein
VYSIIRVTIYSGQKIGPKFWAKKILGLVRAQKTYFMVNRSLVRWDCNLGRNRKFFIFLSRKSKKKFLGRKSKIFINLKSQSGDCLINLQGQQFGPKKRLGLGGTIKMGLCRKKRQKNFLGSRKKFWV